MAKCPAHDDRRASLSVGEGEKGRVLLKCHAGCPVETVLAALGLEMRDLFTSPQTPERRADGAPSRLGFDERSVERYLSALLSDARVLGLLEELRGWSVEIIRRFEIGLDGDRIVFPYRDATGAPVGLGRYQPDPALRQDAPKLQAARGSKRELFPSPESVAGDPLFLVEGEGDALAALSAGLSAVGIPGVSGWQREWNERLSGRRVVVLFDCDQPGRDAASRIAADLAGVAKEVRVVDLDPSRSDGYDLTELLLNGSLGDLERLVSEAPVLAPRRVAEELDSKDAVLRDTVAFLKRHLAVEEHVYVLLAIWAAHTHAIESFGTTPYLHITSTEPSSGKTRVLELLELLVRSPMRGSNLSLAVLYRAIDQLAPTLLVDEVDNLL